MAQSISGLVWTTISTTTHSRHGSVDTKKAGAFDFAYAAQGDQVVLRGTVVADGALAAGTALFTLPVEARPSSVVYVPVGLNGGGTYVVDRLVIGTNGTVKLTVTTLASGDEVYLDGVSFSGPGFVLNS